MSKDDTLALIGHLETVTAQADGSLDSVNLALVMALLYCLDVSFVEQGTEDREGENMLNMIDVAGKATKTYYLQLCISVSLLRQLVKYCLCVRLDLIQALPLLTERQYVSAVHSRLMDGQPWKLPGLQAVCRLAWALSLRVLSQLPQGGGKVLIAWIKYAF